MRKQRPLKLIKNILKNTNTDKIVISYFAFVFISALIIWIVEPGIKHYGDALWYCYAVISTAGFGDVVVTGFIAKILSVAVTIYSVFVIAIVTGVVVNYYTQLMNIRNRETLSAFMDKLEHLPEMSKEELEDLSKRVTVFRESGKLEDKDRTADED